MNLMKYLKSVAKINDAIKAADVNVYYISYYIENDEQLHTTSIVAISQKRAVEEVKRRILDKTGYEITIQDVACL